MGRVHDAVTDPIHFVIREARLLDEKRFDEWYELFAEDGHYWVPASPGQPDPLNHNSLAYEDKLLLKLRIERLKQPTAYSQKPASRCHHLLQTPTVESFDEAANRYLVRTEFHYTESQGDELQFYVGTCYHHVSVVDGALRMTLKRVNLLNCDAALPAVQLFI